MKIFTLCILLIFLFKIEAKSQDYPAAVTFRDGSSFSGYADFQNNGTLLFRMDTLSEPDKFDGIDVKTVDFEEEPYNKFEYIILDGKLMLLQKICEGELEAYAYYNEEYSFQITLDDEERKALDRLQKASSSSPTIMNYNGNNIGVGAYSLDMFYRNHRFYIKWEDSDQLLDIKSHFRKDALELFKDCPGLVRRIKTREWKYKDLKKIVEYYNDYCSDY